MALSLEDKTLLQIIAGTTLTGSAIAALTALAKKPYKEGNTTDSHSIYIPLSYRNMLRVVRSSRAKRGKDDRKQLEYTNVKLLPAPDTVETALRTSGVDSVADLSDKDIASLKRQLLKGASDCASKTECKASNSKEESKENNLKQEAEVSSCNEVKHVNAPVFEEAVIGQNGAQPRDSSGRFTPNPFSEKKAQAQSRGWWDTFWGSPADDSTRVANYMIMGSLGLVGGAYITKKIFDKIQLSREETRLERARRRYADAVTKELNDVDIPYYTSLKVTRRPKQLKAAETIKTAGENEPTGLIGQGLGILLGAGALGAGTAALLAYKILQNRYDEQDERTYKRFGAITPNIMFTVAKDKKDVDLYK
jgi:hypothetical protein